MTRFFHIALIILIGFVVTPTDAYACDSNLNKTELNSTQGDKTSLKQKGCCDTEKNHCRKHGKDCAGKCGNPDCHCPTNGTNFTIPFFAQLPQGKVILIKSKFYYQETYYSSGFLSVWLPPKIC